MGITNETRRESYQEITKDLNQRQKMIIEAMVEIGEPITAKGLAMYLYRKGSVNTSDRNIVHPRLNELVAKGLVTVIGKRTCEYTNKKVALYKCK